MNKLNALKETNNFAKIENIDLIKNLRGTQYSLKIEKFFEFDFAFKKLEEGFENFSVLTLIASFRQ